MSLEIHNHTVYVHCERCGEQVELDSVARIFYAPYIITEPKKLPICRDCADKFQHWFNVLHSDNVNS